MMKPTLLDSLSLKIHGDALTAGSFGSWAGIARLIMWVMALVECLIWGYAATYLSEDVALQYLSGVCAGAIVLIIILTLDISILTAPLHRISVDANETDLKAPRAPKPNEHVLAALDGKVRLDQASISGKFWLSVVLRVTLAIGSIVAMSPLLNIAVFNKDITSAIEKKRTIELDAVEARFKVLLDNEEKIYKTRLSGTTDLLNQQEKLLAEAERKRLGEVDGTGGSRKPGVGPIAEAQRAISEDARQKIVELRSLIRQEEAVLKLPVDKARQEFDNFRAARAERKDDLLRDKYSVKHNANSLASRMEMYNEEVKNTTASQTIRWIIFAFQGFLLAAFLFMKLFEPLDARVYYSQDVQNLFHLFLVGEFDQFAQGHFTIQNVKFPISPSLFLNEIIKQVENKRRDEIHRNQTYKTQKNLDAYKQNFEALILMYKNAFGKLEDANRDVAIVESELFSLKSALNQQNTAISEIETNIQALKKRMATSASATEKSGIRRELADFRNRLNQLHGAIATINSGIESNTKLLETKKRFANLSSDSVEKLKIKLKEQELEVD